MIVTAPPYTVSPPEIVAALAMVMPDVLPDFPRRRPPSVESSTSPPLRKVAVLIDEEKLADAGSTTNIPAPPTELEASVGELLRSVRVAPLLMVVIPE